MRALIETLQRTRRTLLEEVEGLNTKRKESERERKAGKKNAEAKEQVAGEKEQVDEEKEQVAEAG